MERHEEIRMKGFRVWELQSNGTVKEIKSGSDINIDFADWFVNDMDNEKTYKIRIGKTGLK